MTGICRSSQTGKRVSVARPKPSSANSTSKLAPSEPLDSNGRKRKSAGEAAQVPHAVAAASRVTVIQETAATVTSKTAIDPSRDPTRENRQGLGSRPVARINASNPTADAEGERTPYHLARGENRLRLRKAQREPASSGAALHQEPNRRAAPTTSLPPTCTTRDGSHSKGHVFDVQVAWIRRSNSAARAQPNSREGARRGRPQRHLQAPTQEKQQPDTIP